MEMPLRMLADVACLKIETVPVTVMVTQLSMIVVPVMPIPIMIVAPPVMSMATAPNLKYALMVDVPTYRSTPLIIVVCNGP
jgi:hypothetical protein